MEELYNNLSDEDDADEDDEATSPGKSEANDNPFQQKLIEEAK